MPPHPPTLAATGDTAVVLLDRRVVRVHKNGLSRTFAQRVVEVLTERGAEDNKEFEVHYTPGSEEVDIRQARIYRRDARGALEVLEATDRSDEDLSEPWYGLYYDNRAEVVRFEGLRPGDVVEIQYVVDDVSSENQMADYFGDLQYVAETIPKRRWDYTLIAPEGRPIHTNVPRVAHLEQKTTVDGDDRVYTLPPPTWPRSTPSRPCRARRRRRPTCTSAPTRPGTRSAPGTGASSRSSWPPTTTSVGRRAAW